MATLTSDQVQNLDRPAYLRTMAWLMPRMSRAFPSLGYVLVSARQPAAPVVEPP